MPNLVEVDATVWICTKIKQRHTVLYRYKRDPANYYFSNSGNETGRFKLLEGK
jgi:hypothetical protein